MIISYDEQKTARVALGVGVLIFAGVIYWSIGFDHKESNGTELENQTGQYSYEMKTPKIPAVVRHFQEPEIAETQAPEIKKEMPTLTAANIPKKEAKKAEKKKLAKKGPKKAAEQSVNVAAVDQILGLQDQHASPATEAGRYGGYVGGAIAQAPRGEKSKGEINEEKNQQVVDGAAAGTQPQDYRQVRTAAIPNLGKAGWMFLLKAQPTIANAKMFIQAHHQRQLTDDDFFSVALDLLESGESEVSQVAGYVLREDYSPQAFSYLAKAYVASREPLRANLWKIMATYSEQVRWLTLLPALSSQDKGVVKMATEVLSLAVENQGVKNPEVLSMFTPSLTRLSKDNDQQIAGAASAVLADIRVAQGSTGSTAALQ